MGTSKVFFSVETIHLVIAVAFSIFVEIASKSKYKSFANDKYIDRIRRDTNSFIDYLAMVVLCIVLSVAFSENTQNIFDWTIKIFTIMSMGQYMSFKNGKDAENEHYNKIKELVDFMVMVCWGAMALITLMNINAFWVTIGVMTFFAVASLWGLKELKKIESDYLSTM